MRFSDDELAIVRAVKARVKETDVPTVRARQKKGDTFYLVDVREDNEWDQGHLPGAIHLGKGVIERDIEGVIPEPDAEIILYCGGGYRSALAAENLARMGYTNVVSMDGGFRGWNEAGFPIEHDD